MTILVCSKRHVESHTVPGSGSKDYIVKLYHPREMPSCTCIGFMTKRNKNANAIGGGFAGAGAGLAHQTPAWCKHLEQVQQNVCGWQSKPKDKPVEVCPNCKSDTVPQTDPLAPNLNLPGPAAPRARRVKPKAAVADGPFLNKTDAIAKLKALLEDA